MNWDQVQGKWKQMKGSIKEHWGKLTGHDLDTIAGKRDQLAGKIQERYGLSREDAHREIRGTKKQRHNAAGLLDQHRSRSVEQKQYYRNFSQKLQTGQDCWV